MAKYRKKPVVVEAEIWPGTRSVAEWASLKVFHMTLLAPDHPAFEMLARMDNPPDEWAWVATLEGGHIAEYGDRIITGVEDEKYPIKPRIFEATYEPVNEEEGNP